MSLFTQASGVYAFIFGLPVQMLTHVWHNTQQPELEHREVMFLHSSTKPLFDIISRPSKQSYISRYAINELVFWHYTLQVKRKFRFLQPWQLIFLSHSIIFINLFYLKLKQLKLNVITIIQIHLIFTEYFILFWKMTL